MKEKEEYGDEEISIDFTKYLRIFRKNWKFILKATCISAAAGVVIALCIPRKYTVVTKVAPEISPAASNRLSLASLVMSNSMLGMTDAVYPMVYPDLISSPDFITGLFNVPVSFNHRKERVDTTLYAYLNYYQPFNALGLVLSAPGMLLDNFSSIFRKESVASEDESVIDPYNLTMAQGRTQRALEKCIIAKVDKKTLVLTIETTANDPEVCAALSKAIADHLQKAVKGYRTRKASEDCLYFKRMLEDARAEYYEAQDRWSRYADSHQNVSQRSYMIEADKLKNETSLAYQLYTSMSQQYQTARAKVQQETPVFAEIVKPTVPQKSSNSKKKIVLAITFLGFIGTLIWVFCKRREE